MSYLKNLIIDIMCILLPLCLYLKYIAYINTAEKKEHKYDISVAIISSLILLLFLDDKDFIATNIFFTIPLLLSYIFKKDQLSILISIILVFVYHYFYHVNFIILTILYTLSFFIYKLFLKKNLNLCKAFSIFIILKILLLIIIPNYIINKNIISFKCLYILFTSTISFIIFTYLTAYFITRSKQILEINTTFKQLDKEKKLRAAVFKLNHELKNPLAVCNGYLEMLEYADDFNKTKYLEIIRSEIKRSLTIINDFSSLGKIKSLDKEEIDLCLLLEDVKEVLEPIYSKTLATINIPDKEIYLEADYNRLKQVFINILKNSYESKKNIPLVVNIKVRKEASNYVINIIDNGCGMSKEALSKIYDDFFTTKPSGTGIGIPYIKEIIDLHGGSLFYKSREGIGTTVIIKLPC